MQQEYKTVKGYGEKEIVIQKSRFISHARCIQTEGEAIHFIESVRKEHGKASHHCSAYVIGKNDQFQKASDDGEPSGTAGKPILEVIKKLGLKDSAVVVTRYFGGIKLGSGGLIRAYGQAASEGLKAGGIIRKVLHSRFHLTIPYPMLGKIENDLRSHPYILGDFQYLEKVTIPVYVRYGEAELFKKRIIDLTHDQAEIRQEAPIYIEHEVQG